MRSIRFPWGRNAPKICLLGTLAFAFFSREPAVAARSAPLPATTRIEVRLPDPGDYDATLEAPILLDLRETLGLAVGTIRNGKSLEAVELALEASYPGHVLVFPADPVYMWIYREGAWKMICLGTASFEVDGGPLGLGVVDVTEEIVLK